MKQYEVLIELKGMEEPCYRKVVVDEDLTMHDLHLVVQTAMGWNTSHLYEFITPDDIKIAGYLDGDDYPVDIDANTIQIHNLFNKTKNLRYIYDFGDWWEHDITIKESINHYDDAATVIEAVGVCPPDDVGGVGAYQDFLDTLNNADAEDKQNLLDWLDMIEYSSTDTINVTLMNVKLREMIEDAKRDNKILH